MVSVAANCTRGFLKTDFHGGYACLPQLPLEITESNVGRIIFAMFSKGEGVRKSVSCS